MFSRILMLNRHTLVKIIKELNGLRYSILIKKQSKKYLRNVPYKLDAILVSQIAG